MNFVWDWDYGLYLSLEVMGWRVTATVDGEPMFGIEHPDGRFFGFWFEDFEFDVHRAPTSDELEWCSRVEAGDPDAPNHFPCHQSCSCRAETLEANSLHFQPRSDEPEDMGEIEEALKVAHRHSLCNRKELEASPIIGCFCCHHFVQFSDIKKWVDLERTATILNSDQPTAICPICGVDSLIGSASGFDITADLLKALNDAYFGGDSSYPVRKSS